MIKYEIILSWSDEDRAFVAKVPELPGCMAHGDTPSKRWNFGLTPHASSAIQYQNPRASV